MNATLHLVQRRDPTLAFGPKITTAAAACDLCETDAHRCTGCGRPLGHMVTVCLLCRWEVESGRR